MGPKTERFEMRLDEVTLERVDRWREDQPERPSRAEAMRRLIEEGLQRTSSRPVRFSDGEKLLIAMMRDIYKGLDLPHAEIDPEFVIDAIDGGHNWAFRSEYPGLFHDYVDSEATVRFVAQVLTMWDFLERGYKKLSKSDKDRVATEAAPYGSPVEFTGFDGNNESSHMSIARVYIEQLNRFAEFKGRSLNSHMPTLSRYVAMLSTFEPMRDTLTGRDLSAKQIIEVLNAGKRWGVEEE